MIHEIIRFFTAYLWSFILCLALLPLLIERSFFDPKVAGSVVIFVTAIISYIGHMHFSFKS